MMNRLFHVLVLTSVPSGVLACGSVEDSPLDDEDRGSSGGRPEVPAGSGGEHSGRGGEHSETGGQTASGGREQGGGGSGGAPQMTGGSASSGGAASGGATEQGTGGQLEAPSELPCPSEQWSCAEFDCPTDHWLPTLCSCDASRPRSAEDCDEGETFVCGALESGISESGIFSCQCTAQDLDPNTACRMSVPSRGDLTAFATNTWCNCALILIR